MAIVIIESAQVGFFQGILILIGILWIGGYLKRIVYVPVVIKEKSPEKEKDDKEVIIKDEEKMIYRTKEKPNESYTDFEEIK